MIDPLKLTAHLNRVGEDQFLEDWPGTMDQHPIYFFDELETVPAPGHVNYVRVIRRFRVWIRDLGCIIEIAPGFEFDWDSVPRLPIVYLLFKGRIKEEACLHDWLYKYARACGKDVTWWQAERALAHAMKAMKRRWYWRVPINTGTALGGWIPWRRYRRAA